MTATRRLYVVNESTLVDTADVRKMAAACNVQVRDHAAPAWHLNRVLVGYKAGTMAELQASAPPGTWVIAIMDTPDQAGALGWHWQDAKGNVYGEIFAKPCLDAGSSALAGTYAVSSVLSHEVLETLCDPLCTSWSDTGRGYLVTTEVCDPVEADGYDIGGVWVSNFVKPAWFTESPMPGGVDYLGKLTAPFSMGKGGYWVQMPSGNESQQFKRTREWLGTAGFDVRGHADGPEAVFSPEMPEWRRELKMRYGRNVIKRGVSGT